MKKAFERILAMVLALILAAAFPVTAAADGWVFPDEDVNIDLVFSIYQDKDCRILNAFASNYVEANLQEFNSETPDSTAIAVTLKHLELNEGLFGDDVTKITGEDGRTYMKVSASIFEARVKKLFGRNISAEDCPGYEDGYIIVSADNFGGPIQVFASVYYCDYEGDGIYTISFYVYYVSGGVTDEYNLSFENAEKRNYEKLGSGQAWFYCGYPDKVDFTTADLTLLTYVMYADGIPCTNENLPMAQAEQSTGATEAPAESAPAETEPRQTEAPEESVPAETERRETEPPTTEKPANDLPEQRQSGSGGMVLLIVLLVIVIALLALAVILLLYNNRKR